MCKDFLSWDEMADGYLSCSDFETGPRVLTIRTLVIEQVMKISGNGNPIPVKGPDGRNLYEDGEPVMEKTEKRVMHFYETGAGLIINQSNKALLKKLFGLPTTNWKGKRIALYAAPDCKSATRNTPAQPGLRVYGSPDLAEDMEVVTGLRPQPNRVWKLVAMKDDTKPKPTTQRPTDTRTTAEKIADGEKHLGPDVAAEVRTAYGAKLDADPADWGEDTQQGYLVALMKRAKGA